MPSYPSRDLTTQERTRDVPADFLQSVFALELLAPSRPLWIVSPWVSDIELLNNEGGRFSALNPDWPNAQIRLVAVLETLAARGGEVVIVTSSDPHNDALERRLHDLGSEAIRLVREQQLHMKGIVGEHFTLDGSMNLTYNGVHRNEEHLIYRTDPAEVQEHRVELAQRWGGSR